MKCCLNYELDTYLDALQHFPENCDTLRVARGNAVLIKKDIFKNVMWYTLPESNKQYPLSIERAAKIKGLNQQGIFPDELEPVEVATSKPKEIEPEYADLVGQISLKALDKADKKKNQQQQKGQKQKPKQGDNRQQATGSQSAGQPGKQQGNRQQQQQRPPQNQNKPGSNPRQQQQQRPQNPKPPRDKRPPQKGN